jgi:hypothetical protein
MSDYQAELKHVESQGQVSPMSAAQGMITFVLGFGVGALLCGLIEVMFA